MVRNIDKIRGKARGKGSAKTSRAGITLRKSNGATSFANTWAFLNWINRQPTRVKLRQARDGDYRGGDEF